MSRAKDVIRSAFVAGYSVDPLGNILNKKGKLLKGVIATNGYRYVSIYIKGLTGPKGIQVSNHQMAVYDKFGEKAFTPNIEVRHLDGDRLNNHPNNIAIGTRHDNIMDMSPEQRSARVKGKPSPKRVASAEAVADIQKAYASGLVRGTCTALAKKYGLSKSTVSEIGRGTSYVNK